MDVSFREQVAPPGSARRAGAAALALAAVLGLGACKADGGGYIGEPLPGGPVSVFDGDANFGFNFTCHVDKRDRAVIRGRSPPRSRRQHRRRSRLPRDPAQRHRRPVLHDG